MNVSSGPAWNADRRVPDPPPSCPAPPAPVNVGPPWNDRPPDPPCAPWDPAAQPGTAYHYDR